MSEALVIPGITDPNTLVCIARARTFKQYRLMVENAVARRCPFCTLDPKTNKVIAENQYWRAWQSPAPEKHTEHHFIIAPKKHCTDTEELGNAEWITLKYIMTDLRNMYRYQGRGILIRDGDARLSAGTIEHLHIHVMVPDGTGRVESPFYKGAEAEGESLARAIVFEKLRKGMPTGDLSPEETLLIKDRIV